jgi:hypothetical protein
MKEVWYYKRVSLLKEGEGQTKEEKSRKRYGERGMDTKKKERIGGGGDVIKRICSIFSSP